MSEFRSDREKKIDNFLKQLTSQSEWLNNLNKKLGIFKKKYNKELENYEYIKTIDEFYQLKLGGYIRYFNLNDEFRWGGILLRVYYDKKKDRNLMVLTNKRYKRYVVSFDNNYIFYRKHKTQSDNYRNLFLSFLDKYE
jgi:uncharacterized protein YeaO (DUF488 family)